ncbi:MAG: DUF4388 domain-containing protein [Bdellovibrionota bacterium]
MASPPTMQARRILLVDGDKAARAQLAAHLRGQGGREVLEAEGADEAFDLYQEHRPDVIVSDVFLSQGSGLDLCARVAATGPTPVVLMSDVLRTREQQRQARERYGARAYFIKPADFQALTREVDRLVSGRAPRPRFDLRPQVLTLPQEAVMEGEFGPFVYPLLLMALFRAKETGVLSMERQYMTRTIYFVQGVPVFIASASRQENLGRLLVEKGRITEEDYVNATRLMQEKKIRQGEALVELGILDNQELYAALQEQAREKLVQGFGWEEGHYSFSRTQTFLSNITLLELDPHAAVAEGVRRFYPLDKLGDAFEAVQTAYPQSNENFVRYFDRLRLTEEEARIASFSGMDAIRDLAALPNVDIKTLLRTVTILLLCDMVTLRSDPWQGESAVPSIKGGVEEAQPPTPEDEAIREVILENYLRVSSFNYFQVLGVKSDASEDLIRKQYEKLSRKYHPDNYKQVNLGPLASKLEEIYLKIELAYRTLTSSQGRAEYEAFLKKSEQLVLGNLSASLGAEMEFCRGRDLLEAGDYEAAADALRMAVEQNPLEAEYRTLFGVSLFRLDPRRAMEARSHINRALSIDPNNALALAEIGRIYAYEGKYPLARKHLEAALRVRPSDESIQQDLARVEELEKGAAP